MIRLRRSPANIPAALSVLPAARNLTRFSRARKPTQGVPTILRAPAPPYFVLVNLEQIFLFKSLDRPVYSADRLASAVTMVLVARNEERPSESATRLKSTGRTLEKCCTLIRYDIQCVLKKIYELTADENLRTIAAQLIDLEEEMKYEKTYATVWRSSASFSGCTK